MTVVLVKCEAFEVATDFKTDKLTIAITCTKDRQEDEIGVQMTGVGTVRIGELKSGSIGERAGLMLGDTIMQINGEHPTSHDYAATLMKSAVTVALQVQRDSASGDQLTITCIKQARDDQVGIVMRGSGRPRVDEFKQGSLGKKAGLLLGDTILKINGEEPAGHGHAAKLMKSATRLVLEVRRASLASPPTDRV